MIVYPCVYVLELEDACYYVGVTNMLNIRLSQHWSGQGAKWTRIHKPLRVKELHYPAASKLEQEITDQYIKLYGKDKVRGGSHTRCDIPSEGI